jgi:hypothetical protein
MNEKSDEVMILPILPIRWRIYDMTAEAKNASE